MNLVTVAILKFSKYLQFFDDMHAYLHIVAIISLITWILFLITNIARFFYILIFLNKFIYLLYLFLAALGLRCCSRAFSSYGERGLLFFAVHGLLIAVASLVAEHGLLVRGLSSCGLRALERRPSSCGARA